MRFRDTRAAAGELQFDHWNVTPEDSHRWETLRESIRAHGLRNSLLIAIAPTATIASIAGCYECIEPQVSNLFKRETLSGDFLQVNRYLVDELKQLGLWTDEIRDAIKLADGSVQGIAAIPEELQQIYRTAWELPMRALIDLAAERGAYIDQSQSLNLFMANPNIGQLSSMYMYAWKTGLEDHLLPAVASGDEDRQDHGARADEPRPGGDRLLARESGDLRGLPVSARHTEPAGSRLRSDAATDALSALLRDVSRCHQEHLDGGGDRLPDRSRPSAAAHDAGGAASDRAAGGVLRHRRHHRGQQSGDQPVPAHQRARGADVSVAPAVRGGAAHPVLPDAARQLRARPGAARAGLRCRGEHSLDPCQGRVLPAAGRTRCMRCTVCKPLPTAAGSC